jgi:hypothetical protein
MGMGFGMGIGMGIAIENGYLKLIYLLKMVIFHSYVSLPEGIWEFWNEYQLGIFIESNIMEDWKL